MVHSVQDKMKEHGMMFVFAGPEKDDDTKLHTVVNFKSDEHSISFSQDEELTRLRAEAGAITPITDSAFIKYPKTVDSD